MCLDYYTLKNVFQHFILDIIIFDLWLLMKINQCTAYIKKLVAPTCKVFLYGSYGLMFVIFCTILINMKSFTSDSRDIQAFQTNLMSISDLSKYDAMSIQKELLQVKNKAKFLEFQLSKVNTQMENLYSSNRNKELPDFASEASGGDIIATPDTESYKSNTYISFFGIPLWKINVNFPRKILQPWTQAGECWPFVGHRGKVEIRLAYPIKLDSVTIEHIPLTASLTGSIDSAPKNFNVYAYFRQKYILLDSLVYDIEGNPSQTFIIKNQDMRNVPIKRILLEITSNWGNPDYTCIYRFRVHGEIFKIFDDAACM